MKDEIVVRLMKALISDDAEEKKKLLAELSGGVTWGKYLEFTQKEISSMPQKFRKLFRIGKLRAYIRERKRGKSVNYEVRCRMDGINVSAGGTTKEEAFLLANAPKDAKESIAVILYTGLRPCEYKTLRREGDMLIAQNCKRKDGKIEYKRIPICPMLVPLISDRPALLSDRMISRRIAALLPGRSPYDLRTTFNTRCVECHVDDNARKLMMGHSLGVLGNAYTDVSDDFLRGEAQKIDYPLPLAEKSSPNSFPNA